MHPDEIRDGLFGAGGKLADHFEYLHDEEAEGAEGELGPVFVSRALENGAHARVTTCAIREDDQSWRKLKDLVAPLKALEHPNIAQLLAFGRLKRPGRGDTAYFVHEHADGATLSERIAAVQTLDLRHFVPIAAQVLKAVGSAHTRDVFVGGVRPQDIMLLQRGKRADVLKVRALGIRASLLRARCVEQASLGLVEPPEHGAVREFHPQVDVFGFGVLCYWMLSGRVPFENGTDREADPLPQWLPPDHEASEELLHLVHDCIELEPSDRPADANVIVESLIDCVPSWMFRLPAAGTEASMVGPMPTETGQSARITLSELSPVPAVHIEPVTTVGRAPSNPNKGSRWVWIAAGVLALGAGGAVAAVRTPTGDEQETAQADVAHRDDATVAAIDSNAAAKAGATPEPDLEVPTQPEPEPAPEPTADGTEEPTAVPKPAAALATGKRPKGGKGKGKGKAKGPKADAHGDSKPAEPATKKAPNKKSDNPFLGRSSADDKADKKGLLLPKK